MAQLSSQQKRRMITLILCGCTCLLCLLMGVIANFEPTQDNVETGSSGGEFSVLIESEETIIAQAQIESPIPDVPLPDIPVPNHPPVNPVPEPDPESVKEEPKPRTHIVSKGDTLSSISLKYYGSASRWQEIYRANQAVIPNKNSIKIGTVLTIPSPESHADAKPLSQEANTLSVIPK